MAKIGKLKFKKFFLSLIGTCIALLMLFFSRGVVTSVVFPVWSPPKKLLYPNVVNAKVNNCRFLIPVTISNRPGVFLFDPSVGHSYITPKFSKDLPYSFSIGNWAGISLSQDISIGSMEFGDIRLPIRNIVKIGKEKIDGVLGVDFLIHVRVTLDFQNKKVIFDVPNTNLPYRKDGTTKLHYSFRTLFLSIDIAFGGREYRSLIDFSENSYFMKLETNFIKSSKKNHKYVLLGKRKVRGRVELAPENPLSLFQESQSSIGCKLFSKFKKISIDFKQERLSYKL
jgi:hypothetical protein